MSNNTRNTRAPDQRDRRGGRARPPGPGASPTQRGRNPADARAHAKRNYERYIELARAAVSAGDPIEGENLYQHAEHYFRAMKEHDSGGGDQGDRA